MFRVIPPTAIPDQTMCNLYSQTKSQDAMRDAFEDRVKDGEDFDDLVGKPTNSG